MFFCLVAAFLAPAALIIFNLWILPPLFQKYAQDELSNNLGFNLTYEKIAFDPRYGVVLKNFSLQKKFKKGILLHKAESAKVDLDLLSLVKGRLIIEQFKISRGKGQYIEKGKSPILFSFENFYGSLRHVRLQTVGLGGWLGSLCFEDLFINKNVLIGKIQCAIAEREIRIEDVEMFLQGHPVRLNVLIELENRKMNLACKLSESGFLLATNIAGRIEAGLFSRQTKLLFVTDPSRTFRKSQTFFQGVLELNDFSEMMDLWGSWKRKVLFKSPIELEGQSIGLESGKFLCTVPLIAIRQSPDRNLSRLRTLDLDQVKLDLDFYRHQFLINTLEAKSCNGFIQAKGLLDLIFGVYEGQLSLRSINMSCLGPFLFSKGKEHRGILSGSIESRGLVNAGQDKPIDFLKSFWAEGNLEIEKGNLGKIQLLKNVLRVFGPIFPNLGKIKFKSGYANFFISSGNLFVKELKMMSSVVRIECNGKMGLEKKDLDLDLHFTVSPLGLKEKTLLSKIISGGLIKAEEQLWKAKISGTLKKPEITPLYFSVLQPVKEVLRIPFRPFQKKESQAAEK
jgi:hypothetical protein